MKRVWSHCSYDVTNVKYYHFLLAPDFWMSCHVSHLLKISICNVNEKNRYVSNSLLLLSPFHTYTLTVNATVHCSIAEYETRLGRSLVAALTFSHSLMNCQRFCLYWKLCVKKALDVRLATSSDGNKCYISIMNYPDALFLNNLL